MIEEGGRLVRYVVSKQTDEGAWFYAEPPSASHITHDNYHTGFILDAILVYGQATKTDEFDGRVRRRVSTSTARRLFEPDGAARFMSDQHYPIDIHGCAQGVITFALQQKIQGEGCDMSQAGARLDAREHVGPEDRTGSSTSSARCPAADLPDQDPRAALVPGLDVVGARLAPRVLRSAGVKGFPGRELSLDPGRSRFERTYAKLLGAPANGLRIRLRRVLPATDGTYRRHPRRRLRRRRLLDRAGQAAPRGAGGRRRAGAGARRPGERDRAPRRAHEPAASSRAT